MTLLQVRMRVICLAMGWATNALAEEPPEVQHFRAGVKLFQEGNYKGALAEFEEAYRLKPTANTLNNIAVTEKALFRYVRAKQAIETLLRDHAHAASSEDLAAARRTLEELKQLITTLRVIVRPPTARVLIDGQVVEGTQVRTIEVDPGEHHIEAEAPGHKPFDAMIRVAGRERTIDITLVERLANVLLVADDPDAAIAVDATLRGYGEWSGALVAGERHIVTVYKPGHRPTELALVLEDGETREVRLSLGPKDKDAITPLPYSRTTRRGPYGLLTATYFNVHGDPDNFAPVQRQTDPRDGTYFGLRLGYLLTRSFGVEGLFETGKHTVGPGCYPTPPGGTCPNPPPASRKSSYELAGLRVGGGARYISRGETWRWLVAGSVGLVHNAFRIKATADSTAAGLPAGYASASNAYLSVEGGIEVSVRRVLIDGVIVVSTAGTTNLAIGGEHPYEDRRSIVLGGVGLRMGYALW